MATTMIQVDPREIDALHVRSGWAVGAMEPTKRVARALGKSERLMRHAVERRMAARNARRAS